MELFKTPIKVVDCTFRDGGYYTDWFFDKNLVEKTLNILSKLPIEYVEIGFRQFAGNHESGPLAYTTDEYLKSLNIPKDLKLAAMVEVKHLKEMPFERQRELFPKKDTTPIDMIRLSSWFSDLDHTIEISNWIKAQGYKLSLNIIHISGYTKDEFAKKLNILSKIDPDIVYLADTYGNLVPHAIRELFSTLQHYTDKPIGFHSHDNRGLALANVIAATEVGATWIDATITGMGRGAGNLKLESLLLDLLKNAHQSHDLQELINLVNKEFASLKKKYGWGHNALYHHGAISGLHPMKLQTLLNDPDINFEKFVNTIQQEYK